MKSTKALQPLSTLWHKILCALFKIADGYELPTKKMFKMSEVSCSHSSEW